MGQHRVRASRGMAHGAGRGDTVGAIIPESVVGAAVLPAGVALPARERFFAQIGCMGRRGR
ncbi:putative ABC-type transport system, periplasmic component [Ralstonia solanacearum Po82]|uniref:Putative ABC-type transport system, periplasmic component n=1 Tax=Ralstonia solanacearum (strain Po82) TaxID=1031711 RepID=F6G361_RALS8|nr:putative ABC-type transport system, periplasmic component [Ralstonia solanacearum Po82]